MKYVIVPLMLWVLGFVTSCSIATAQPLRDPPPEPVEAKAGRSLPGDPVREEPPADQPARQIDRFTIQVPAVGSPNTLQFIRVDTTLKVTYFDVMVITGGGFVEAVETKNLGEFVFTGPPGRYTIRVAAFDPDVGFVAKTQTMEIRGGQGPVDPVIPPDPVEPPPPIDPDHPPTGPPPIGRWDTGPVVYEVLIVDRPDAKAAKQLATNFEWAATVKGLELTALMAELKKRNEVVYNSTPALSNTKKAWTDHMNRLITNGVLKNDIIEHQEAYAETAAGIRAAYGK